MKRILRISWGWLGKNLRAQFLIGFLVVVPLGATAVILVWIFVAIDNILRSTISSMVGHDIPGVGFVVTIVLIYLIGAIASNVVGKRLINYGETVLGNVPVVRQLYTGIKQILASFSAPKETGFMQVVLVEFPRKGMRTIGFITNEVTDQSGEKLLNIFIPTAPNPTSGFLQIAREEEITRTDISVDDAVKMIVSAGRMLPEGIGKKLAGNG